MAHHMDPLHVQLELGVWDIIKVLFCMEWEKCVIMYLFLQENTRTIKERENLQDQRHVQKDKNA